MDYISANGPEVCYFQEEASKGECGFSTISFSFFPFCISLGSSWGGRTTGWSKFELQPHGSLLCWPSTYKGQWQEQRIHFMWNHWEFKGIWYSSSTSLLNTWSLDCLIPEKKCFRLMVRANVQWAELFPEPSALARCTRHSDLSGLVSSIQIWRKAVSFTQTHGLTFLGKVCFYC